jgi:hypothetical protein
MLDSVNSDSKLIQRSFINALYVLFNKTLEQLRYLYTAHQMKDNGLINLRIYKT